MGDAPAGLPRPGPDPPVRAPSSRLTIPAVAALAALAYVPSLWAGFAADDYTMLTTVEGLDGPLWVFERNDLGEVDGGHFYRPLWVLLNAWAHALGGGGAAAFHAINLLLYALAAVEVVLLVRVVAGRASLLAGAAFALYPRHTESVAWASGNTDLLATALALAALLCATAPWPARRRIIGAVTLTILAALSKESAFVLPILAALVLWARPRAGDAQPRLRLLLPAAMAAALVPVLILRTLAIGGIGGYAGDDVTPLRILGSTVSYLVAAVTPHQVEILRWPALALIPLALLALALVGALRLRRGGETARMRALALGLGFFAAALLPVVGEPLDLNNATGERLLFLPSVGLTIALAALLPTRPGRAGAAALTAAGAVALALCLIGASNWTTATDVADRTLARSLELAPAEGGELVLLSIPESYRNAHVFTNSLDRAIARSGRPDLRVSWCAPVHLRSERAGLVSFAPSNRPGELLGRADPLAPFDFPVAGQPGRLTAGCSYARAPATDRDGDVLGLRLNALARPVPERGEVALVVFDGRDLRRLGAP
jgi:hypothetical protein